MLRDDLDEILSFIGAESLTDDEFDVAEGMIDSPSNDEEVYTALVSVLNSRELVGDYPERLRKYYAAMGISFDATQRAESNIFIGGAIGSPSSYTAQNASDLPTLSPARLTAMINLFTSTLKGAVPASGGGTENFLRADGSWAEPPGGGGGSGTVESVSVVTANGVSGTVANDTTTPAITIILGAITPTSVAAAGTVTGSNLSGTNTGDQTISLTGDVTGSGAGSFAATIAANAVSNSKLAQMATLTIKGNNTGGSANASDLTATQVTAMLNIFSSSLKGLTPASGGGTSNFLRADGTWAAPSGGGGGSGDVVGPASATDSALAVFDTTTGKLLKNSVVTIDNSTGAMYGAKFITGSLTPDGDLTLISTYDSTKGKINFGADSSYDETFKLFGIGTTNPTYPLDVRGSLPGMALHVGTGDYGVYLVTNSSVDSSGYMACGATIASDASSWVAKSNYATLFGAYLSDVRIYGNTGLTPGTTFAPIERFVIETSSSGEGRVGVNVSFPLAQFMVISASSTTVGAIVRGASSQTADLIKWQDSASTVGGVHADGSVYTGVGYLGADGSGSNSAGLDIKIQSGISTGNATPTKIRLKGTAAGSSGATPQTASDVAIVHNSDRLEILASQIDFTNLPTSDPGVPGRLYRTAGAVMVSI